MFKFVDLFCGVGGFHIAFSQLGGKCISACDIDKFARVTYETNYRKKDSELFDKGLFFEDITKLSGEEIPDHTILCGGFPCQAFSIAGYQRGFEDPRGNLFFDTLRIINKKKPKVVFLENVKNLASHDGGKTLKIILDALKDSGYFVHTKVLNTAYYGNTPQNRERVYIVGFDSLDAYNRFRFPEQIPLTVSFRSLLDVSVDKKYYYEDKALFERLKEEVVDKNTVYQRRRIYVRGNKSGVCPTLTANMGTGGHNVPIILDEKGIRKLTPRETFRLQGFPESFILPNLSDSHLYKQAGNSVSVKVLERIGYNILFACGILGDEVMNLDPGRLIDSRTLYPNLFEDRFKLVA